MTICAHVSFTPLRSELEVFFLKGNRAENSWVASQALQTTGSWNTRTCGPKSRRLMFDNNDNNCNIKIVFLQIVSDNDERINTILLKYWFLRKIKILNEYFFFSKNAKKTAKNVAFNEHSMYSISHFSCFQCNRDHV